MSENMQHSINATTFGCWRQMLEQNRMDQDTHIALSKTLMRSQNGSILTAGGAKFDFSPWMKEYIVKCKDGRVLTIHARNRTIVRLIVGHHNVVRIFE